MSRVESMVGRFVEYKQALGYDFYGEAQRLRAFVAFLGGRDATEDEALAWAAGGSGHPRSYQAQRYETVRRFSEFARALDPSFPSMRPGLLGSTSDRVVPYIYTEDDACVLMRAALSLKSPDGLRVYLSIEKSTLCHVDYRHSDNGHADAFPRPDDRATTAAGPNC